MSKSSKTIPLKTPGFVINSGRPGFYRVKYDNESLNQLQKFVSKKQISHIDRWAIQNDLHALVYSGDESIKKYLEFTQAYYDEDYYLSCVNVGNNLFSDHLRCFEEPFSDEIRKYARDYFLPLFKRLGWDKNPNEKHTDALLRGFVISALGKLGDKKILTEAHSRFKKFLKNPDYLRPDLRESVFSLVALQGNQKVHQKFITLYRKAKTQEEKLRFLGAMCSFKDEKLLLKTLNFSQTREIRSQNMQLPIMRIAANPYGKKILWPWLQKNWKQLSKKVGHGNPLLNRIIYSIGLVISSSQEQEVRKFFKKNPTPGTERTLEQTLERVRINTKFLQRTRKEFLN